MFLSIAAMAVFIFGDSRRKAAFLPIGVLFLIANSAFRDFATSGFETSLTYLLVVIIALYVKNNLFEKRYVLISALASLLVLNRPETILILAYLFTLNLAAGWHKLRRGAIGAAGFLKRVLNFSLPALIILGGYQVFRMGYYAAVFPNTFYAKKGGSLYFSQGLTYINDFFVSYGFQWIIIFFLALLIIDYRLGKDKTALVNRIHLFAIAFLMIGYVLYSGGDYMHGRFLLISLLFVCVSGNDLLGRVFSFLKLKFPYQIIICLPLFFFSLSQKPLPILAKRQLNRINDERAGFGFQVGNAWHLIKKYLLHPITPEFGWSIRGAYYKALAEKLSMPITVGEGNIGFFGYNAGSQVRIIGCSLTDYFLSRQPILKRGTIGHEGEQYWPYIFFQQPHFMYTPYRHWNKTSQFKDQNNEYSYIIRGDDDDSFKPVCNVADKRFTDSFSRLINIDIKAEIDKGQAEFLRSLDNEEVSKNRNYYWDYFDFLERYWLPYASAADQELFLQKREEFVPRQILTQYDDFDIRIKPKVEAVLSHITGPLTVRKFLRNIKFALSSLLQRPDSLIKIYRGNEFRHKAVEAVNLVHNKEYGFLNVKITEGKGSLAVNVKDKEGLRYVIRLFYRAAQKGNSLSVGYNDADGSYRPVFEHDVVTNGEFQTPVEVFIDVTEPVKKSGRFYVRMNRPFGPTEFEVAILELELFGFPQG
jgi:hypothetical protein